MNRRSVIRFVSAFAATVVLPATMFAASAADTLKTPDSAGVTRGDFLRASIQTLGITLRSNVQLPYRRPVPVSMQPYVKTALYYDALPFGNDLALAQSVTRGQAIQILAGLTKETPKQTYSASYKDVGTDVKLQKAVELAIEENWLKPESDTNFGINKILNGKDARALLDAAALTALPAGQSFSSSSSVRTRATSSIPTVIINLQKPKSTSTLPNQDILQALWKLLNDQYLYNDKIDSQEAAYSAAEALVNSLKDPYTTFMRPATAKDFQDQIGGQVTGIGAQVEYKDNTVIVVAPLAGSPALKAGLKAGDMILKANDENIVNIGFQQAVNKIRGPKGTSVKLRINRNGNEFDVSVQRDTISVPEIDISFQGSVAVVRLAQFGEATDSKLRGLLTEVQTQKPKGIILDLRNNPGGLLHAADVVVSNFLPKGSTVARIMARDGESVEVTEDEPTIDANVPVVVLVNKGSASASEITAAALQDYKRAIVIGEQTFGKGTVQQILEFKDGSELKMTIAEWLTPLKRKINGIGVTPDVPVSAAENRDDQLLKAIELLR